MMQISQASALWSNSLYQIQEVTKRLPFILPVLLLLTLQLNAQKQLADFAAFQAASKQFQPGDTIILQNGIWENADLQVFCLATAEKPLVIKAATPGQVIFTGASALSIGGSHIQVSGLVFKQCFKAGKPVIRFRTDQKQLANHCRVTDCVVDDCNPNDRLQETNWIALFGRKNQFDHNRILNKKNLGTTLIVELNDTANQQNKHLIADNYFGPRAKGGSNGAETIRIGTSTFSRTSSQTIVQNNFFDRCNGEVEIISIKSCDNVLSGNTFYECEGGLVLRHGNRNLIENNVFIGNHKPYTGGVRVINAGHTIRNNQFIRLAGFRFRSALTILNGVPNSPINRYDQVKDVRITDNLFMDCANMEFCAGKDFERTARPERVTLKGNLILGSKSIQLTINDLTDGFLSAENYTDIKPNALLGKFFQYAPLQRLEEGDQMFVVHQGKRIAVSKGLSRQAVGTSWVYNTNSLAPKAGQRIPVQPGINTIAAAVKMAGMNDTLVLRDGATYQVSIGAVVKHPLAVICSGKAQLQYTGEQGIHFFQIENGGALYLKGLICDGLSPNGIASSFVSAGLQPMIDAYQFKAEDCVFKQLTDGRKHAFLSGKGSFADSIVFRNCVFYDITGDVINIAAEKDDVGRYNAEQVVFDNCLFQKILQGAIHIYRGGNDESTTGPIVTINRCTFAQSGNTDLGYAVRLYGVQGSSVLNSIFYNSGRAGRAVWIEDFGWTKHQLNHCLFFESGVVQHFYPGVVGKQILHVNPLPDWKLGVFTLPILQRYGTNAQPIGSTQYFIQ
jgi:poly(beta-D-mannuronate) lyase